jgi:hypothetical protein
LEELGYEVVAAWMSPSHDDYVRPKASRLSTKWFPADVRLLIASLVLQEDDFVKLGAWEAQQPGRWPDFPEVAVALQDFIGSQPEAEQGLRGDSKYVRVFYCCGTDHAERCGLYRGVGRGPNGDMGVVVVPREGETPRQEVPQRLVYVAKPAAGDVASFSSTKVRTAMEQKDESADAYLRKALCPEAARLLLQPTEAELEAYPELAS